MKRALVILCAGLIGCGSPFAITPPPAWQEDSPTVEAAASTWAKIIVLDVGQGDAALLITPSGEAVLIDTGPPELGAAAVLEVLSEQSVETIPYLFISHHHEDHDGGLAALLTNPLFSSAQVIDLANAPVGETLRLGDLAIEILGANGQIGEEVFETDDENARSVALLIEYGAFSYLTSGDLTGGGGNPPYQTIDLETPLAALASDVDILHINHHGSHTSTNQNLLDGVTPEAAVISLGDNNDFFHPHPSVIERLLSAGIQVYQTERGWLESTEGINVVNGHICILTDGTTYEVEPYAKNKCAT